jgi:hypothetical protein
MIWFLCVHFAKLLARTIVSFNAEVNEWRFHRIYLLIFTLKVNQFTLVNFRCRNASRFYQSVCHYLHQFAFLLNVKYCHQECRGCHFESYFTNLFSTAYLSTYN